MYALKKSAPLPGFRHLSDMNVLHFLRTSAAITKVSITSSTKAETITAAKVERNVTMKLFTLLSTVHCKGSVCYGVLTYIVQPIVAIYRHVHTHSLYIVSMYLYLIAFQTISVSRTRPKNLVHTHYPLQPVQLYKI